MSDLSREECKSAIDEISNELYNLHISLKSLTRENTRIKNTIDLLLERNALLENELLTLKKYKKECQIAKDELILCLKMEETTKKHLDKELEVIRKWTESAKVLSRSEMLKEKLISLIRILLLFRVLPLNQLTIHQWIQIIHR